MSNIADLGTARACLEVRRSCAAKLACIGLLIAVRPCASQLIRVAIRRAEHGVDLLVLVAAPHEVEALVDSIVNALVDAGNGARPKLASKAIHAIDSDGTHLFCTAAALELA